MMWEVTATIKTKVVAVVEADSLEESYQKVTDAFKNKDINIFVATADTECVLKDIYTFHNDVNIEGSEPIINEGGDR